MRRIAVIVLLTLFVLPAAVAGLGWYLSGDEAFLKSQLNRIALKQTGRSLAVDGRLRLDLGRVTTIEAEGIRFSNAPWASETEMVRLGRLLLAVDLPSLWRDGPPVLPHLEIEDCRVSLAENDSGETNWDLADPPAPTAQPSDRRQREGPLVLMPDLKLRNCILELDSPRREERLVAEFDAVNLQLLESRRLRGNIDARLNGDEFVADGWLQPLSAVTDGGRLEHEINLQFGAIRMHSAGSVAETGDWSGVDVRGWLRGPDIEKLLEPFAIPAFSEGAFDFSVALNSEGPSTLIQIDGDLGSVEARVSGELDRLIAPSEGNVDLSVTGPDLAALGRALQLEGLPDAAYRLESKAVVKGELIHLDSAELLVGTDRLVLSGSVNAAADFAGTELEVTLEAGEAGRYMPLVGQAVQPVGPVSLQGTVTVDPAGSLSLDTRLESGASRLKARGGLGPFRGPLAPDLDLDFETPDPRPWAALAGWDGAPGAPLGLRGRVKLSDQQLQLHDVRVTLDDHAATVDGVLNLAGDHAGSRLEFRLDIKDAARLGDIFGVPDLPSQPLLVALTLQPEGKGLAFGIEDGSLGDIRVNAKGRIANLDKPLGVDADFLVRLPSLADLGFLLPDRELPDEPFQAQGRLVNEHHQTRLDKVEAELGPLRASVDGTLGHEGDFNLRVAASTPDASVLKGLLGWPLPDHAFSLTGQVTGNPSEFELDGFAARLGDSVMGGDLNVVLADLTRLSGSLASERLDLRPWQRGSEKETDAPAEPGREREFLLDDTPVIPPLSVGFDVDLRLDVKRLVVEKTYFQDVHAEVSLNPGGLTLSPFSWRGQAGGQVDGELFLDVTGQMPRVDLKFQGSDIYLGLAAAEGQDPATFPPIAIDLALTGQGATQRELASGLNGRLRWYTGSGLVASTGVDMLFSDFITELFQTLNPFAESNEYTQLDCSVAAADFVDGQVSATPIIFHTEQLTILSEGTIDLDTEKIDLSFATKPRQGLGLSAGVLINPLIKVGGRLAAPAVELDPKGTVVSGGVAVATAGLSLLAKSMSDRFLSSKDPCGDARREIEQRDAAASAKSAKQG